MDDYEFEPCMGCGDPDCDFDCDGDYDDLEVQDFLHYVENGAPF